MDLGGGAALGARGVLQLAGPDAPKLLQGLVTNDVLHLPVPQEKDGGGKQQQQGAMAVAFLTNKGGSGWASVWRGQADSFNSRTLRTDNTDHTIR